MAVFRVEKTKDFTIMQPPEQRRAMPRWPVRFTACI